jgi:outer membrane receptor protein involved in Fe transport
VNVRIRRSLVSGAAALFGAQAASAQARACSTFTADSSLVAAPWSAPLDRPVSAHSPALSLRDALDRIAAIAKIRLSYSSEIVPLDRAVCLSADAAPVGRVLSQLLAGANVTPIAVGADQVVLAPSQPAAPRTPAKEEPRPVGVLDRVVVTGTATGAPERELTVGLDVLDGRQLAREDVSSVSGAVDGRVPGVWTWTQSPTSIMSSYASIRGASSFGLSYPKVYIDGIEVANPLLISRLSPDAIERIEVIRGPQGSALYGMDAISGVVNIVTRSEGTGPEGQHAAVSSSAGIMQSDFSRGVLSQNHSLSLATGTGLRSADLHVSGGSVGDFIPGGFNRNLNATGSARTVGERATFSATARYFMEEAGSVGSPLLSGLSLYGDDSTTRTLNGAPPPQSIREYTLGTNATYAASDRLTHSATIGIDGYRLSNVQMNAAPVISPADSALLRARGGADRVTLRGSSVYKLATSESTQADITVSAEHGVYRATTLEAQPKLPVPSEREVPGDVSERMMSRWESNSGITGQANASYDNTLFFTGGLRLEHDSRLPESQVMALPMIGAAAVNDFGPITVKLRGAYGEGVRPPSTFAHAEYWQPPNGSSQSALGPERQAGTEAGVDVLWGRAFSVRATRFDQRASGLIQEVMLADSTPMSRRVRYDLENVGVISNRGWELETSASVSRLTVSGTLSLVSSRVENVASGYNGDLRAGDRMLQVPARTGSVNVSWLGKGWYASFGGSRALDWINYDELGLAQAYASGARDVRDMFGQQLRQYWRRYDGGLRVRASASRDIRGLFTFEVSGDNLLNYQRDEPDNATILPGRTIMTGLKVKF